MTVSLAFDIVILVICAIIVIKNAVRGFIKSFITFSKTILAFLLAYLFNAPVARFFSNNIFLGCARGWIYDAFCSTKIGEDQYALYQLFDGIPDWFTNVTVSSGVEDWMVQEYFVNEQPAPMWALNKMSNSLGEELSYLISVVVAFLAIFLLAEIVIGIIGVFLNKLGKKSMLKVINIILGACIGLVISTVIAWLITLGTLWVLDFGGRYYPDVFSRELLNDSWTVGLFEKYDIWSWIKSLFK